MIQPLILNEVPVSHVFQLRSVPQRFRGTSWFPREYLTQGENNEFHFSPAFSDLSVGTRGGGGGRRCWPTLGREWGPRRGRGSCPAARSQRGAVGLAQEQGQGADPAGKSLGFTVTHGHERCKTAPSEDSRTRLGAAVDVIHPNAAVSGRIKRGAGKCNLFAGVAFPFQLEGKIRSFLLFVWRIFQVNNQYLASYLHTQHLAIY